MICTQRDHFSDTRESLESLYADPEISFPLVYVDGGSPRQVAAYLREQSRLRNFKLIRIDHYLSQNRARNIGAVGIKTPYLLFVDNDVVVAQDWLESLLECAEQTGADVVCALTFERRPLHTRVHFAGGVARIETSEVDGRRERHLVDKIHKEIPTVPIRSSCTEYHCFLVRTEAFRAIGGCDEAMLGNRDNIDFSLTVGAAGYVIYLQPAARVTFLPPEWMAFSDVPFFGLRWSDGWDHASFQRLRAKWDLVEDAYFKHLYGNVGWRRTGMMMRAGVLRWLPSWKLRILGERVLRPLEKRINRTLSRRYAARYLD